MTVCLYEKINIVSCRDICSVMQWTAGKPWTESINQSIGCQICRAKCRQPRFNAQVALHNYVNKIIRDTVPQKNLLGKRWNNRNSCFFYLSQVYSHGQMTDRFWQLFRVEKGWKSVFFQWPILSISLPKNMAGKNLSIFNWHNHIPLSQSHQRW